jgi:quinol monooxygenase YgiN
MNQQQVQVVATLQIQADKIEAAHALLRRLAEGSSGSPGNQRFEVLQSAADPGAFVTLETWASAAAADAHMASPAVGEVLQALGPMLAGAPAILRYARIA